MMEINDWSDLRKFDNDKIEESASTTKDTEDDCKVIKEKEAEKEVEEDTEKNCQSFVVLSDTDSNNPNENVDSTENLKEDEKEEAQESYNEEPVMFNDVNAAVPINDWSDLKKLDDDYEEDWYSIQEKKLAAQYGGNFIRVKYVANGRVSYVCELCVAECNAKKSLDLHCAGMKHLKKKDLWEKEGKPAVDIGIKKFESKESSQSWFSRRSPSDFRDKPRNRDRRSRERSRPRRNRSFSRERSRSRERRRRYSRERDSHYSRDSDRHYSRDKERGTAGGRSDPPFYGYNHLRPKDVESRRGPSMDGDFYPSDMDEYGNDYPHSRNRRNPDLYKYEGYTSPRSSNYKESGPVPPSPPSFNPDSMDNASLPSSSIGSMLTKLSQCCVKTPEDADFAVNVVSILTKSLKDYSHKNGETKISELLSDAELKIGTVKALKVGMKMLSNFADNPKYKSASSIATEYMASLSNQGRPPPPNPVFPPPPYNANKPPGGPMHQNFNRFNNPSRFSNPPPPRTQFQGFNPSDPLGNINWNK